LEGAIHIVALDLEKQLALLYVVAELGINSDHSAGSEGHDRYGEFYVRGNRSGGMYFGLLFECGGGHEFHALGLVDFNEVLFRVLFNDLGGRRGSGTLVDLRLGATSGSEGH
jgi:hypothetical protein